MAGDIDVARAIDSACDFSAHSVCCDGDDQSAAMEESACRHMLECPYLDVDSFNKFRGSICRIKICPSDVGSRECLPTVASFSDASTDVTASTDVRSVCAIGYANAGSS